jgi:hypothetical protein
VSRWRGGRRSFRLWVLNSDKSLWHCGRDGGKGSEPVREMTFGDGAKGWNNELGRRWTWHTEGRSAWSRTACELGTVRYRHLPLEQDLRMSEPLFFAPGSKAMGAVPFRRNCTLSRWVSGLRWRLLGEQRAAEEKRMGSPPVGYPPEITNAREAFWQHME